ncbi:uncharacterized protein BO97DRAFT_37122 [Aspergillus homomorphus CBS 101889]|uniref:Uncharacterized protein n=1 Tax=Aspergillus homomorphus (strain CBS 101889) TaxID=1450537 RepID=A0A395HH64_ASPHC|nr:hypothetical protein BO97DRAFT_37122 [Aspergillus homomorphus CBS 101889]RAL06495.1 hypothetical protein BO97DRAFT_37122 [Aspergillus homomorphus CBS 101889]
MKVPTDREALYGRRGRRWGWILNRLSLMGTKIPSPYPTHPQSPPPPTRPRRLNKPPNTTTRKTFSISQPPIR